MDSIYFEDPLGLLIELASYRFEPPRLHARRRAARGAQAARRARRPQHRRRPTSPTRSRLLVQRSRESLSDDRRRRTLLTYDRGGSHGREHAQHPQAERQQPDRARSSCGPPGSTSRRSTSGASSGDARVPGEGPRAPHADARGGRAAARLALGELRDHAVPLQQARARPALPDRPGRARDGRQRDVLPDRRPSIRCSRARRTRRSASRSTRARSAPPTPTTS